MINNKVLTYISLFSCAGIGCYGFKQVGYQCIATNEIEERRIKVQKINNKCTRELGYINGDITLEETKQKIFDEIEYWKRNKKNDRVDVVIATPPCQGMSVANHKKAVDEINRNSLVVESVNLVKEIKPRFFVFENVAAFWKTGCVSQTGEIKAIGDMIHDVLGKEYIIMNRILNFKNYGSKSSRTRTVVIGVEKKLAEFISPLELYPKYRFDEVTLREVIGFLPSLEWGQFDPKDFYHQFRTYSEHMREWIHDLKEGEGAFDNKDPLKRPYTIKNGIRVENKEKNADKYTRQVWGKIGPCIHTRNDQLASQNTVHPIEDRVFSIRELMKLMTIPNDFKWIDKNLEELNSLNDIEKRSILKKEEMNIRQCIGEAVPTYIFEQIALKIKEFMQAKHLKSNELNKLIVNERLQDRGYLLDFIKNDSVYGYATLARIAEMTNTKREEDSAYFTNKFLVNEIIKGLPDFDKDEINILEPSVGVGNFLPLIIKRYESKKRVNIDVVDINVESIEIVKALLTKIDIPSNFNFKFIVGDYLLLNNEKYDLTIGNPPFKKEKASEIKKYQTGSININTRNLAAFFLEKAIKNSGYVAMIMPKFLLNTVDFAEIRSLIENYKVECIQDFGENGFTGVKVETVCIFINTMKKVSIKKSNTKVISMSLNLEIEQKQQYIFDHAYPYWLPYRNSEFDKVAEKLEFGIFDVFRDRQITNSNTSKTEVENIRVLKSQNISDDGTKVIDKANYDTYIDESIVRNFTVFNYYNATNIYLTPNMTYYPRMMKMPKNVVVNGSVAILIPKFDFELTKEQMLYYSSKEFRDFYRIARNYQTRSLNIDKNSCFWFGRMKGCCDQMSLNIY